ncbi:MAG: lipid-A-disaccharide synthase, partial [Methylococcales bacterium]
IAGKSIVPELIQNQAKSRAIFEQLSKILNDNLAAKQMRKNLDAVWGSFGELDGIAKLAELAVEMLPSTSKAG